jgi:hypothetical protein
MCPADAMKVTNMAQLYTIHPDHGTQQYTNQWLSLQIKVCTSG